MTNEEFINKLKELKRGFLDRLPQRLQEIETQFDGVLFATVAEDRRKALLALQAESHKLAGAAGTHGYREISEAARTVELSCEGLSASGEPFNDSEKGEVRALLTLLRQGKSADPSLSLSKMTAWKDSERDGGERRLLLVDDDPEFSLLLQEQTKMFGYTILCCSTIAEMEPILTSHTILAVLMDVMLHGDEEAGPKKILQLRQQKQLSVPVIYLSVRNDTPARLGAVRAGCEGYLVKPFDIHELITILDHLVLQPTKNPYRVAVIDDDPEIASYHATLLQARGVICKTVHQPLRVLALLQEFTPDVILMDVNMPECNGFELAALIRQFPQYIETPIIFLTAEGGLQRRVTGIQSGGDEFLEKGAEESVLVAMVFSRAKRARSLKGMVERLSRSELRFQTSLNFANIGIWDWDIVSGELLWSEQIAPMFGYPMGDLETSYDNFIAAVHPEDRSRLQQAVDNCLQNSSGYEIEHRVVWPDGTVRWLYERGDVTRDSRGEPLKMLGVVQDITRRKEAEEEAYRISLELQQARAAADRANQAKSEFLSSMSHELRTPIHAILGFAQVLCSSKKHPLNPRQQRQAEHIIRGGEHLLRLVDGVLDLARIEAGRIHLTIEQVETLPLIEDTLTVIRHQAEARGITLQVKLPPQLPPIRCDAMRAKQALLNLLSNAVKYNREQGRILVKAESAVEMMRITVCDQGRGIDPERSSELFTPFSRLGAETTEVEGSGIGLALSKRLMREMSGDIGYESGEGGGSCFWLAYPLARDGDTPSMAHHHAAPHQLSFGSKKRRLLYVEDDPANLALMEDLFDGIPEFDLISAIDGETGLTLAEQYRPDVIILDIYLPGIDGFATLAQLQQSATTATIPVVALTADAKKESRERGLAAGFVEYLTKPLEVQQLLTVLEKVLERAQ
ncbi:MAG: response regulator [Gammaproteobacteria bacterium]|nr:response regulator [Gammaproteobacteria bacterium]